MNRVSLPCAEASTRAMTCRSTAPGLGGVAELAEAADLATLPLLDPRNRGVLGEVPTLPSSTRLPAKPKT